jgi:ATP-dependent exoDNAse (exonuclease V) beta subunit
LVHEALKAWHFPAGEPQQAFERWGRARARSSGLTDARQLDDAVRRARRLLDRCQAHWLHAEMAAAEVRWHEVPYSLGEENGMIDALFRYGGRWTLVDFKTDELRHAGQVEQKLDEHGYRAQVQRYAAASEALLGERPRCLLCWLDVEGAVRVDEIAVD